MFQGDVSFTHTKDMFDREKTTDNNHFGGAIIMFLCLPPYNLNFRYFEIKSIVPRTLTLQDSSILYSA